jgi:hypothetical protein
VPNQHFVEAPFNLEWASHIWVKVIAFNFNGDSPESDVGNGAQIFRVPDAPTGLVNRPLVTMGDVIGIEWLEGTENGGTPVIDYRVSFDQGISVLVALETSIAGLQYTAEQLTPGMTYRFTIAARNNQGYSPESAHVDILAAQQPDQPDAPLTAINGDYVDITWSLPFDQGSPITEYTIEFKSNDNSYHAYVINCNGATSLIINARACTVPISVFKAAPYELPWGASIYAHLTAYNLYGQSLTSADGNGAVILTVPDAPVSFEVDYSLKTITSISLMWADAVEDGGTPILDYTVSWVYNGAYEILQSSLTDRFITKTGLTTGESYQFKV